MSSTGKVHSDHVPRCGCLCWLSGPGGEPCQAIVAIAGQFCEGCRTWEVLRSFYREQNREKVKAERIAAQLKPAMP